MAKDKNGEDKLDLNKFGEDDSVSLRDMNFGLWLSEKRVFLMRVLITSLIIISAGFFVYSAYQYYIYFTDNSQKAAAVGDNVVSPHDIIKDLKTEAPLFFKSSDKYDLVVKVTNENDKFSANFQACFSSEGQEITCVDSFVLPSESKYIFSLGNELKTDIKTLTYSTKNISWQRIDAHSIPNWTDFSGARLNFTYTNINFYSITDSNFVNQSSGNILEFNAENLSPYSYYSVPLNISLFEGTQLVSVNTYYLQNFLSGETRNIKINWPGDYQNARVEIAPNINILDDSVFLKYQGVKTS